MVVGLGLADCTTISTTVLYHTHFAAGARLATGRAYSCGTHDDLRCVTSQPPIREAIKVTVSPLGTKCFLERDRNRFAPTIGGRP
jgi:hypothetical protein